jgi:hypothetical protein
VNRLAADSGRTATLPLVGTSRMVRADGAREICDLALALLMAIGCAAVGRSP